MTKQDDWNEIHLHDNTIEIVLAKSQSAEKITKTVEDIKQISGDSSYDILVDASEVGQGDGTAVPMALKLFKSFPLKRFAIFGASAQFANMRIKVLMNAVNRSDRAKFFRKEEDARTWLSEEFKQ
jgi:hypothetical protein